MEDNNPNLEPQAPQNEPSPVPEAPQQQMPPQQPVPPQQVPPTYPQNAPANNNMPVIALVCGILGLVGAWIPVVQYFTTILSILGIVFGVKGRKTAPEGKTGMATAGMVLGIISLALSVVAIICVCVGAGVLAGMGALS